MHSWSPEGHSSLGTLAKDGKWLDAAGKAAYGRPELLKTLSKDAGDRLESSLAQLGATSALLVPVCVDGRPAGLLIVGAKPGRRGYRPSDLGASSSTAL